MVAMDRDKLNQERTIDSKLETENGFNEINIIQYTNIHL